MSGARDGGGASLDEHVTRHCLACDSPRVEPVLVLTREGALPNTPEHDFAYSHDVVVECSECAALRLEVWRHDCFDFESHYDRYWYFPVDDAGARELRDVIDACPAPGDEVCACVGHLSLVDSLHDLPPRDFTLERPEGTQPPLTVSSRWGAPRFVLRDLPTEGEAP